LKGSSSLWRSTTEAIPADNEITKNAVNCSLCGYVAVLVFMCVVSHSISELRSIDCTERNTIVRFVKKLFAAPVVHIS